MKDSAYITVDELAVLLRLSKATVTRLARENFIPGSAKFGKRVWRFKRDRVIEWIEQETKESSTRILEALSNIEDGEDDPL